MQRSYILCKAAGPASLCRRFFSSGTGGQRPIFVAATKQHVSSYDVFVVCYTYHAFGILTLCSPFLAKKVGKTTTSLALMAGLQKRFPKVGFIKPVGQQHVTVHSDSKFWSRSLIKLLNLS